jgi:exodeoxyribonuclease III
MKIATYNVNSIGARLPVLLHWLASSKPDVACLQELKTTDEKFPVEALREAGYEAVWHGQKAWNGVAILARGERPEETRRGLPGDPDDTHITLASKMIKNHVPAAYWTYGWRK